MNKFLSQPLRHWLSPAAQATISWEKFREMSKMEPPPQSTSVATQAKSHAPQSQASLQQDFSTTTL